MKSKVLTIPNFAFIINLSESSHITPTVKENLLKMKKRILLVTTLTLTALIFIHSSMNAAESSDESGFVLLLFDRLGALWGKPGLFTEVFVRKLAHFTEFSVYGFFLSWTVCEYKGTLKGHIFQILFFLLCVPVTDETIQYFPVGRSAEVKDILLDFSGALFGFIVLAAVAAVSSHAKKKKAIEKSSE